MIFWFWTYEYTLQTLAKNLEDPVRVFFPRFTSWGFRTDFVKKRNGITFNHKTVSLGFAKTTNIVSGGSPL